MQVAKWGNSLAVRLPKAVVEALGLKEGDDVLLRAEAPDALVVSRDLERDEALARLRAFRLELPADWKFDREEANAR
jgi:antitoxin MazE